jgi:hypothetical protein
VLSALRVVEELSEIDRLIRAPFLGSPPGCVSPRPVSARREQQAEAEGANAVSTVVGAAIGLLGGSHVTPALGEQTHVSGRRRVAGLIRSAIGGFGGVKLASGSMAIAELELRPWIGSHFPPDYPLVHRAAGLR